MIKKNKLLLALGLVFGLVYSSTLASAFSLRSVLSQTVSNTNSFFMSSNNQAFVTLIGFFVLLLATLFVAVGKVKIFQGSNGKINNQGKAVAVVIALLGFIAIYFAGPQSFYEMIHRTLQMTKIFGYVILGALTFWIVYAALGIGGDE